MEAIAVAVAAKLPYRALECELQALIVQLRVGEAFAVDSERPEPDEPPCSEF